jgi:hypothetical protein
MSIFMRTVVAMSFVASASVADGCSSSEPNGAAGAGGAGGSPGDGGACAGRGGSMDLDAMPPSVDAPPPGTCAPVVESHPIEGANHMPVCSPLTFGSNPPSSGNHYAIWAAYQTYDRAIARGFWVHSLEHGAVVITYNCPGGCADEVTAAKAFIDSLPSDCGSTPRRIILTPDPELDVRFAASAWGYTLRANCFDREAFSAFHDAHYDHGPESICGGGVDPTDMCGTSACP